MRLQQAASPLTFAAALHHCNKGSQWHWNAFLHSVPLMATKDGQGCLRHEVSRCRGDFFTVSMVTLSRRLTGWRFHSTKERQLGTPDRLRWWTAMINSADPFTQSLHITSASRLASSPWSRYSLRDTWLTPQACRLHVTQERWVQLDFFGYHFLCWGICPISFKEELTHHL